MNNPIVVIDSNVYISSLFWGGNPYYVVKMAVKQDIISFTSNEIIDEIMDDLAEDFNLGKDEINDIIGAMTLSIHIIEPKVNLTIIKDDPDDNKILECAVSCKADYLITGDNHLLKLKEYKGIKILKPKDFLTLANKEQ